MSSLCDHSDAFILVKGSISIAAKTGNNQITEIKN